MSPISRDLQTRRVDKPARQRGEISQAPPDINPSASGVTLSEGGVASGRHLRFGKISGFQPLSTDSCSRSVVSQ
jgi:hypothetical protein